MSRYAIIERITGKVVNVVVWDGGPSWAPPANCDARLSDVAGPGDTWNGTRYIKPSAPLLPPPTLEERVAALERKVP